MTIQKLNRSKNTEIRSEMQKVVIKDTGETVLVRPCHEPLNARLTFYETDDGRKFPMFALELLNADRFTRIEIETTVNNALELADLLISELKKGGNDGSY